MGHRCYVLLRLLHNVPIRHRGDVPLRRVGDVPPRRRWCFICEVPATSLGRTQRRRYNIAITSSYRMGNLKYQTLFQQLLQCLYKYHLFLCIQWICLFSYNKVLLFLYILILRNHAKTHILLFYSVLVLTVLKRQVYSCVSEFFSFLLLINFQKRNLFYDSLALILYNSSLFQLLQARYFCIFSYFTWFSQKVALFISFKKYFTKSFFAGSLRSLFISIDGFN